MEPHFVYILYSATGGRFYVGMSADPVRRLDFHNTIEKGFTSRYRPWEIAWQKLYETKNEARVIEQKIKSWKSAKQIQRLIAGEIQV